MTTTAILQTAGTFLFWTAVVYIIVKRHYRKLAKDGQQNEETQLFI